METKTEKVLDLELSHRVAFAKSTNKLKEVKKGQNDVWICANGELILFICMLVVFQIKNLTT